MLYDPVEKQKDADEKAKKDITHKATLLERIEESIKNALKSIAINSNLVAHNYTKK